MLALEDGVDCWIDGFVNYVDSAASGGATFPVADKAAFEALLWAFANDTQTGR